MILAALNLYAGIVLHSYVYSRYPFPILYRCSYYSHEIFISLDYPFMHGQ